MFIKVCCKGYRSFSFTTVMQFLHGLYYNCHAISTQIVLQLSCNFYTDCITRRLISWVSQSEESFLPLKGRALLSKQWLPYAAIFPCRTLKGILAKAITKDSLPKELQRSPCQRNYKGIFPCWTVKALLRKGITKESLPEELQRNLSLLDCESNPWKRNYKGILARNPSLPDREGNPCQRNCKEILATFNHNLLRDFCRQMFSSPSLHLGSYFKFNHNFLRTYVCSSFKFNHTFLHTYVWTRGAKDGKVKGNSKAFSTRSELPF